MDKQTECRLRAAAAQAAAEGDLAEAAKITAAVETVKASEQTPPETPTE
jgi:hypothetical protein